MVECFVFLRPLGLRLGQQSKGRQAGRLDQEAEELLSRIGGPPRRKSKDRSGSGERARPPRGRGRERGSRVFPSIGSPPLAGASSEARSFGFSALGLESPGRLPSRSRASVQSLADGGIWRRVGPPPTRASARAVRDRSVVREETLGRLSTCRSSSGQTLFGESRGVRAQEGVFSQAREAGLGPGGEWQLSPPGVLAEVLHPTLERGKERGLRIESGKAGQGLWGDSKRLPRSRGWRSCLEGVAVLRPRCLVLGEGPKWLTVIWFSGESRKCLSRLQTKRRLLGEVGS